MKEKLVKSIISLIIISIYFLSNMFFYSVNASNPGGSSGGDAGESSGTGGTSSEWMTLVEDVSSGEASEDVTTPLTNLAGTVITVVKVVCAGVAVIMLIVLGIKYMTSAPNERASIMKHAWVYLVGAIILFASSGIITILEQFATKIKE